MSAAIPQKLHRGFRSRAIDAIIDAIRVFRVIAGNGIRLRETPEGTVIEAVAGLSSAANVAVHGHRIGFLTVSSVQAGNPALYSGMLQEYGYDEDGELLDPVQVSNAPAQVLGAEPILEGSVVIVNLATLEGAA